LRKRQEFDGFFLNRQGLEWDGDGLLREFEIFGELNRCFWRGFDLLRGFGRHWRGFNNFFPNFENAVEDCSRLLRDFRNLFENGRSFLGYLDRDCDWLVLCQSGGGAVAGAGSFFGRLELRRARGLFAGLALALFGGTLHRPVALASTRASPRATKKSVTAARF
jgi:hypothetical protein